MNVFHIHNREMGLGFLRQAERDATTALKYILTATRLVEIARTRYGKEVRRVAKKAKPKPRKPKRTWP